MYTDYYKYGNPYYHSNGYRDKCCYSYKSNCNDMLLYALMSGRFRTPTPVYVPMPMIGYGYGVFPYGPM